MMRVRIKMRSQCSSMLSRLILPMLLHGSNSDCVATTTRTIQMAARRCSSARTKRCDEQPFTLDPNRIVAAGQLITNRVERGELGKAYQSAQALVKRRPTVRRLIL